MKIGKALITAGILALLALPVCAYAQEDASQGEGGDAASSGDRGAKLKATIPMEEKAKVVQKKLYPMVDKVELNVFVGMNSMDDLVWNLAEGMRLNYRFHEMFGFQAVGGYVQTFDKSLLGTIKALNINTNEVQQSSLLYWGGADFVWYPMYGKFALLSSVISHYDVGVSLGGSAMFLDGGDIAPAPDVGMFTNLYFNRWLSLRADVVYYALIAKDSTVKPSAKESGGNPFASGGGGGVKSGATMLRNNLFGTVGLSFHLPP